MPAIFLHREKELLRLISEGDEKAFTTIVSIYSAKIYGHLLAYLKKPAIAEEITQDIMMTVWNKRTELPAIENFSGWLYTVTKNRAYTALRDMLEHAPLPEDDQIETHLQNPLQSLENRDMMEMLNKKISQLPPRRQQVFRMSRFEGKSYEEIAKELGISKSAVNQHIVEALGFLRSSFNGEAGLAMLLLTDLLFL